jgi:hypothetical protein
MKKAKLNLLFALSVLMLSTSASAELANGRFGKAQIFDVQRNPAFPVVNQTFTLSNFANPFDDNTGQYSMVAGQYYQFTRVSQTPCRYSASLLDANGTLVRVISPSGEIYGLDPRGFLFVSQAGFGTFVANNFGFNIGDQISYTSTIGLATCNETAAYVPSTTPVSVAGPISQVNQIPVFSTLGLLALGALLAGGAFFSQRR